MKKRYTYRMLVLGSLAFPGLLMAQHVAPSIPTLLEFDSAIVEKNSSGVTIHGDTPENTIVWNEDFANGLPSGWTNQGFNSQGVLVPAMQWEYRGPNTTPNNSVGSRGAYGSAFPLAATTAANGFMVFDSDFLDNGGTPGNFGLGQAAAPHRAILTTSVINLTQHPSVYLEFQQYYRRFEGPGGSQTLPATYLEFSADGGATWSSPVTINNHIAVNSATPNGETFQIDVSSFIGGASQAQIRFIFDGEYYIWMLDDIKIAELPQHALKFTDWRGHQSCDVSFINNTGNRTKYGHLNFTQCRNIYFNANILNFGQQLQRRVRIEVDVLGPNGNVVFSATSNDTLLLPGDTVSRFTLSTNQPFSPCGYSTGTYRFVFKGLSDSILVVPGAWMPTDTFEFNIRDSAWGPNFGTGVSNLIGTNNNFGLDAVAFAAKFEASSIGGTIAQNCAGGTWAWISRTQSRPGAVINVYLYDAMGFDFITGFPTNPLVSFSHTLTAADTANGFIYFPLRTINNTPLFMGTGDYYLVYELFSNNGANPVFLGNDATFEQPDSSSVFYFTRPGETPRWYTGFENSRIFSSPIMHLDAYCALSLDEITDLEEVTFYPNPTSDKMFLEFKTHIYTQGEMKLVNLNGQTVLQQRIEATAGNRTTLNLQGLPAGLYLLQLQSREGQSRMLRVVVQ
jgi:hypothetical protein